MEHASKTINSKMIPSIADNADNAAIATKYAPMATAEATLLRPDAIRVLVRNAASARRAARTPVRTSPSV